MSQFDEIYKALYGTNPPQPKPQQQPQGGILNFLQPAQPQSILADALAKARPANNGLPIYTNQRSVLADALVKAKTPVVPPKTALERKLGGYKDPASDSEQDRQARAERMVKAAVNGWNGFADTTVNFIVKGSYANNTNVKADSDVDIAAIHRGMYYFNDAALLPQDKIVRVPISGKHYLACSSVNR